MTALEATLGQLVNVNSAFHSTVRGAADKSLAAEQAALRSELDVAYDNLKARRAAERQLAAEVEQVSCGSGAKAYAIHRPLPTAGCVAT